MSNQPQQFTQRARQVLSRAQAEAERKGHSEIDTEHLLLAILRETDGVASEFLRALDPESIQARTDFISQIIQDLRSPITAIQDSAQQMQMVSTLDETTRKLVEQIITSADLLEQMISTLLTPTGPPEATAIVIRSNITDGVNIDHGQADLLRGLFHDLKSSITAIKGYTEILSKVATFDERGQRFFEEIMQAANQMRERINGVQASIAPEVPIVLSGPSDLKMNVAKAVADLQTVASDRSIRIRCDLPSDSCWIYFGEDRPYHMILYLISNALQYSPPDNEIRVILSHDTTGIQLRVQDQRSGVPIDELPHIFEKSFRGKNTETTQDVGMGLSVVRSIVTAYGGTVDAKILLQGGIEFLVLLPSRAEAQAQT